MTLSKDRTMEIGTSKRIHYFTSSLRNFNKKSADLLMAADVVVVDVSVVVGRLAAIVEVV